MWGWIFIIPFFIAFLWFQAVPLGETFYFSFFKYMKVTSATKGTFWIQKFIGWDNFYSADPNVSSLFGPGGYQDIGYQNMYIFGVSVGKLYAPNIIYYLINTMLIWIMGFIPQIIVSLALAIWFTDARLKLKATGFWKTVMYMPNLIMAAAFGLLFNLMFSSSGPVVQILNSMGILSGEFSFMSNEFWCHFVIALINFLMWFGNTTLLLMSGIMGIDQSIFESAAVDGSGAQRTFWQITLPLLKPIFLYVVITSLIGGVQLYDVSYIFTQGGGGMNQSSYTIMNYLADLIQHNNYGLSSALSVFMFIITAILSLSLYFVNNRNRSADKDVASSRRKRFREYGEFPGTAKDIATFKAMKQGMEGGK